MNRAYPRLKVEYERISDGTVLLGSIGAPAVQQVRTMGLLALFALLAGFVASSYGGIIFAPIPIAIAYGLFIIRVSFRQTDYRQAARWYLKGLASTLSAEVLEEPR